MLLENKLQRRTLTSSSDTVVEKRDKNHDSPLPTVIGIATAYVGLHSAWKKGWLKPIVKSGTEIFESLAKSSTDKAHITLDSIKKWTKLSELSSEQLSDMGFYIPKESIFRNKSSFSALKKIGVNTAKEIASGNKDFLYVKKVINQTVEDMTLLKKMLIENEHSINEMRKTYSNSDLIVGLRELKKFSREVKANNGRTVQMYTDELASKEFVKLHTLSINDETELMRRNGYRPIMLKDIMEKPIKDENGKYTYKSILEAINLNDNKPGTTYKTSMELLNDLGNTDYSYVNDAGKRVTSMIDDWDNTERMILDKNLLIDENGKIIDLRISNNLVNSLKKSTTTDFQIPVLGFNPLTSLLPEWSRSNFRKPTFGILSKNDIQPFITGKAGRTTINEIFGDNVFVINGKGFKIGEKGLEQFADDIVLNDITKASQYGLNKKVDAVRKMAGLNYYNYDLKNPDKELHKKLDKIFSTLDSGKPDNYVHKVKTNLDGSLKNLDDEVVNKHDIDSFFTDHIHDFAEKHNIYKPETIYTPETIFGGGPVKVQEGINTYKETRRFIATKKGVKITDLKDQIGIKGKTDYVKSFFSQFSKGGHLNGEFDMDTTDSTLKLYTLFDGVFGRLNSIAPQLGFGTESKRNLGNYVANIALKRVLPIYMLTQAPEMLNALSEPIFGLFGGKDDGTDNRNNLGKFLMADVVKPVDLGMHKVKDILQITKIAKGFDKFVPGSDQIKELPGIYQLGLGQTYDERKEYIEKGVDPVRKARYWAVGNTPFTGGKIMYWRPNAYRRVAADVDFSNSKWGSRQEYYSNTWYPNPINPLAPLNHFIFDKNHYDKKHYYDRPYLVTSKEGNNIPLVGNLYSSTVGKIISPQHKMHNEYWRNGVPVEKNDENVFIVDKANYQSMVDRQIMSNNAFINSNIITSINTSYKQSQQIDSAARTLNTGQAKNITGYKTGSSYFISGNIIPKSTDNTFSGFLSQFEVYTTPSGGQQIVDIPDTMNTWEANQKLREYSIKRVPEARTRIDATDENQFNPKLADYTNEKINNAFIYNAGEEFNTMSDFFGMKGFELQTFVTGEANTKARVIEDSNYAYSFNKSFWDENLGGFGGDGSEIFRRFVQKRNNKTDYVNPVRNTMPSWMPGRDYFTDFKHGDPYSKIDNGEERLPGEGYERLYNINTDKMFQLGIGSSYIGKTKAEIQRHLLHQDSLDSYAQDVTKEGTGMHDDIERAWRESGLAINTEGKIEDKENNILGYYDALIHDSTSETGKAIVDIKTVGNKKFNRIVKQNHPDFEHQSQVNYYLWATNNEKSNGYIYYVNRDNPEQTYTMGFKFNKDLLVQNLNTIKQARNEIYKGVKNGTIGRGELYDTMDRYRILADVAPYSQEFQSVKAQLSNDTQLTAEQKREMSEIGERVTQQKEPLRVYPYKFSTSNVKSEKVTVKKIIDNNTLIVSKYGTDHAIKLAGINVSMSNSEKYDKNTTKNDAARDILEKYAHSGSRITIQYDFDEANKFKNDSTSSVRAVIRARGKNVNKLLLDRGLATEKEKDDSPAGIHARYSKNEVAFGSALEKITHFTSSLPFGGIPFVGNKLFQVKSPYEQYRDKEIYGKDFQSWDHPIRDYLKPEMVDKVISKGSGGPIGIVKATVLGSFLGSLFGATKYGKIVGGLTGGSIGLVGGTYSYISKDKNKDWVPKRRKEQEELNTYFDTLKYVKNIRLYEKYKEKAIKENHVDITDYEDGKVAQGIYNKNKTRELKDFKKVVKLDYKHRNQFDFKYGAPEGLDMNMDPKTMISVINKELKKIESNRKVERLPDNVIKALSYKQQADQTMYGYNTGDPLNNLMAALPKKERQYFKYFMKAPEEEKNKILRIAPEYLRRGLQQAWGMKVDRKPTLQEYFTTHGLPDANWIGWDEETNIEDVKVKLVRNNNLDTGEFDIWDNQINSANDVSIDVPKIHSQNSKRMVQLKLQRLLGTHGYSDVVVTPYNNAHGHKNTLDVYQDRRDDYSKAINSMNI